MANCFIAPVTDKLEDDPRLKLEEYVRTLEEEEDLGIDALKAMQLEEQMKEQMKEGDEGEEDDKKT